MIENLHVRNVALIDEAEIQFHSGLNILSGETGAGKSILIDSINFLLGERPGKDFLRSGAETASVEGLLRVTEERNRSAIRAMGIDIAEDDLLWIQRTMNDQGRSSCRVNGRNLSVGMLREISSMLVDIHGQHEHQSLLNPNKHIELLDQICEVEDEKRSLGETLKEYRETLRNIKAIAGNEKDRAARTEILQYQITEIQDAKISPNEEEVLNQRRTVLQAAEKLSQNTQEALKWLQGGETEGEDGAISAIGRAASLMHEISGLDPAQKQLADQLSDIQSTLQDAAGEMLRYADKLQDDPHELEEIEERLDLIYRLKKKYGGGIPEILNYYQRVKTEMDFISDSEERLAVLNLQKKNGAVQMFALCGEISQKRKSAASEIQSGIEASLRDLGMQNARFSIAIERKTEFAANGFDKLEFLISPNPGEPLKPLAKIASGGEMSRVMLALKTVMADADTIETFIFDEIDAGVSGRTAQQVAEKLAFLAKKRQILCITHLPQIAAMADNHYLIEKTSAEGRTATNVYELDRERMIAELARLIGGVKITDATWKAASEMKDLAKQNK